MNLSLYTARAGARAQEEKLAIISNNLANLQTEGYKSGNAGFVDLLYERYWRGDEEDPDTGAGARVEKTDFLFDPGAIMTTDDQYDYAIMGDGFFAVFNPQDEQVYYTRNGHFRLSNYGGDLFYLATEDGSLVLDKNMALISLLGGQSSGEVPEPGVFDFAHKEGFLLSGNNFYSPVEKNGQPFVREDVTVLNGKLEMSNVDLADQMARVIESSRAYQMTLKMVQTSDEVEQTINSLR